MNGSWGTGLLAFQQLGEMLWKCLEIGAWLVLAGFVLWIGIRLWRA